MRKLFSLIGLVGLSLIMSFGFSASQTSASSISSGTLIEEVTPLASSRYVEYDKIYNGKVIPPDTYYYSDSYGYKGTISMIFYIYSAANNTTGVRYGGTVYCDGVCAASQPNFE